MKFFVIGILFCFLSFSAFSQNTALRIAEKGDINKDNKVDLLDFALFATDWQSSEIRSDITLDGIVNLSDLLQLSEDWLKSTNPNNPEVTLQISGAVNGAIVLELFADEAPLTVENFLNYVQSGFYEGLIFHRVISDFMIQGGGFDTNLVKKTTGPTIINESSNRLSNLRGTIAMARLTHADTASSQFFINIIDNKFLDYNSIIYNYYTGKPHVQIGYCVFGRVLSGMHVADAIAALPTTNDQPDEDVIIQSAIITQNVPFCAVKLDGDSDGNCKVDFNDFVTMAENWLQCNSITVDCI